MCSLCTALLSTGHETGFNMYLCNLLFYSFKPLVIISHFPPSYFESAVIRKRRRCVESRLFGDKLNDAFARIRPPATSSTVICFGCLLRLAEGSHNDTVVGG